MARAVRVAMAASVAALALGASGTALATGCPTPSAITAPCPGQATAIDGAPVVDLTTVEDPAFASMRAPIPGDLALSQSGPGDIVIVNSTPYAESGPGDVYAISGISTGGNVDITNLAGADLDVDSVNGSAIGIYGYSTIGDVSVDNAADIDVSSTYGIADGIFASGVTTGVSNSGDISASGYSWAAGIETYAVDAATVSNSGTLYATTDDAYGKSSGVYASSGADGSVEIDNLAGGYIHAVGSTDYGHSAGIHAIGGAGGVDIDNAGDIVAYGAYVYGIEAHSSDDLTVVNSGSIDAQAPAGFATGVQATSDGVGSAVWIDNSGLIQANGYFGAAGIDAVATGYGAGIGVDNSGVIQVLSDHGNAYGIVASANGGATVDNSGSIYTYTSTDGGYSVGVAALAFAGDASVTNSGDIDAVSNASMYAGATGITAFSGNGSTTVDNSGSVSATWTGYLYASARAIDAQGQQGVTVNNSGSLYANGKYAYGVYASSAAGDVVVNNAEAGEIGFYSYLNSGFGVLGVASAGDVGISNAGTIEGYAFGQSAGVFALALQGDAGVDNNGSINVVSGNGTAVGAFARADYGTASVSNSGDITASDFTETGTYSGYAAFGILARGTYAEVGNSGSITADGFVYGTGIAAASLDGTTVVTTGGDINVSAEGALVVQSYQGYYGTYYYYMLAGAAKGIDASSVYGDTTVSNASNITATGGYVRAIGISATAYGDVDVSNTGDIDVAVRYAYDSYNATGIYAGDSGLPGYLFAEGTVSVSNSGDISIDSPMPGFGKAKGIDAVRYYGDVIVNNSGDIDIYAGGRSYGIFAMATEGNASVVNTGDINMQSPSDATIGLSAATGNFFFGGGDASVQNAGDISVHSGYGLAVGIQATAGSIKYPHGNSYILNTGDIDASSQYFAYGIQTRASDGTATIVNTGDVNVATAAVFDYYYQPGKAQGISALTFTGGDLALENHGDVTVHGYALAYGLYAKSGNDGNVAITNAGDVSVDSQMHVARGAFAKTYFGDVAVTNAAGGTIEASSGLAAVGVQAITASGSIVVNNAGDIHAGDSDFAAGVILGNYALAPYGDADWVEGTSTLNNASTGSISVDGAAGNAWAVLGFDVADTINNAGDIAGSINLYGGNDAINNVAGGTLHLDNAEILLGSGENAFSNAGTIRVAGTDNLIDMGTGPDALVPSLNPLPLVNTGIIDFVDDATDDVLTIVGDLGGNGAVNIDLDLAGLASDQLYVDGSVVDGASQSVNVNFTGVPTNQITTPVVFAHVTGNAGDGSFVAGEVLGGSPANFLDLDALVMRPSADTFAIGIDVAGLNDTGTIAAAVAPGAANLLNSQIGTFKQRMGVNPYGDAGKVLSAFARYYTSEGDVDPAHQASNFGQGGNFAYDQNTWGREIGINAHLFGNFHAGLTFGNADGRQRLAGTGVGENRMDGNTWGAYATWLDPDRFYVDLSYRAMAVDVQSTSAASIMGTRARTNAWNAEAGYQWALGGVSITPQLQYTLTRVEDVRTMYGDLANFESTGGSSTRARAGVEFSRNFDSGDWRWTPYGSVNAVRQSGSELRYVVADGFVGVTDTDGTSTMAELGLGVQHGGWGFTIGANWLDGGAYDSTVSGQASLRFAW